MTRHFTSRQGVHKTDSVSSAPTGHGSDSLLFLQMNAPEVPLEFPLKVQLEVPLSTFLKGVIYTQTSTAGEGGDFPVFLPYKEIVRER